MALWLSTYVLQERYHRLAGEHWSLAGVMLIWVFCGAAMWRARPEANAACSPWPRALVICTCLVPFLDRALGHKSIIPMLICVGVVLIANACLTPWFAGDSTRWARARAAMVVSSLAFSAVPVTWALLRAPDLSWPPRPAPSEMKFAVGARPAADIVILFDEWSAGAAEPVSAVLRQHGFAVDVQSVPPAADGTLKMTPRLFLDKDFDEARPCTPSALCSGGNVLDFARIRASRDDVDIVGFFQPYCDIQGLRYCFRGVVPLQLFRADLWRCFLWRRLGWPLPSDAHECARVYGQSWEILRAETLEAVTRAPVWTEGGVLFAHLPLPHPPAQGSSGNLMQDYAVNVELAARFIEDLINLSSRNGGIEPRFLLFSDHPLRVRMWCTTYWSYMSADCRPDDRASETAVPLVVAARHLGAVPRIVDNAKVLELLRTPP